MRTITDDYMNEVREHDRKQRRLKIMACTFAILAGLLAATSISLLTTTEVIRTNALVNDLDYFYDPTYRWLKFWSPGPMFLAFASGITSVVLFFVRYEREH